MGKIRKLFLVLFLGAGCVSHPQKATTPELTVNWVRSTMPENYYFQRLAHRMTPVLYKDLVIEGNGFDNISAYSQDNGELIWRTFISGGVEGGAALDQTHLYFGANDGNFYAANVETGKILWSFPAGAQVLAAPSVAGDRIFFLAGNNVVYALKKSDGTKIWTYHRPQANYFSVRSASTPLINGSTLYVGTSDGYVVALNVVTGSLLWERLLNTNKKFKDVDSTPVLDEDHLYISSFDGSLYCLEISSGKTMWRYDEGGYLPPTIIGNNLYYATTTKKMVALDKTTGKEIWKLENLEGVSTQPKIWRDWLAFGESEGRIKLVSQKSGHTITTFAPGKGTLATPMLNSSSEKLFFISNEGNFFALRLEVQGEH